MTRVLIANRGEIAVRLIRACRDLGWQSVLAYSEADKQSLGAELAHSGVCIGPAIAAKSYLDMKTLVTVAQATGCDAIHPGYGFLAENADFAALCEAQGVKFVGPASDSIRRLGDKIAARQAAADVGVPVLPGTPNGVASREAAEQEAGRLGYPVLIKAGGGGGGKGLNLVESLADLGAALDRAAAVARAAFDNDALYLEKFLPNARHIEVQVLGDGAGRALHFGERDCTIQRNYQKLVEEAPSPAVAEGLRSRIAEDARALAESLSYEGLGTVEFLYDQDSGRHYFIEMNTRLQVEHPVTELVTGRDLITLQLQTALGEPLDLRQDDIAVAGHAMELRINAEDPEQGFRPSAGRLEEWRAPAGPWVRVDTHCYPGYVVPPYYDSLLAKLIVTGRTRAETITRATRALAEFEVRGVQTTVPFHRWLLSEPDFRSGNYHTGWMKTRWMQ